MNNKLPFEEIERKVLIKREATTSNDYGSDPNKRPIETLINYGIVNINKPSGPTSHQISDYTKKILKIKKAGHSGTLDPIVTGVLPIALGKATRIVQTLLKTGKEYVAIMHLHREIEPKEIEETTKKFLGKIDQLPPKRSAVKRQLRKRQIYYFNILEIDGRDVLFQVGTEAGTYIRKLIHDIGLRLGTKAHMAELIRTKVGPFNESTMFILHDLKDAYEFYKEGDEKELRKIIQPIENAIQHLPKIWVVDSVAASLCYGANLGIQGIVKLESDIKQKEMVAILTLKNELVCIGKSRFTSEEIMQKEGGNVLINMKVFMDRDVYPYKKSNKQRDN